MIFSKISKYRKYKKIPL